MGTTLRATAAGVLALALAGCWPAPGANPDRTAYNVLESTITVATVADLAPAWTATADAAPLGDPVFSGAGVHVSDPHALYGVDPATGARRWRLPAPAGEDMRQPFAVGGRLLVSWGAVTTIEGWTVAAVDAATGSTLVTADGGVVDGVRGARRVEHVPFDGPVATYLSVVDDDQPGAGSAGLIELGAGDLVDDTLPLTLGAERAYHAGPGVPHGGVSDDPFLQGVRAFAATGATASCGPTQFPQFLCPLWVTPLPSAPSTSPVLSPDGATVYVGTEAGGVHALDSATGRARWSASLGSAVTAEPALAGDRLYVPTADGDVDVLPTACSVTCGPLWSARTGSALTVQPAVAADVLVTGSADGSVQAFAAAGCAAPPCPPLWRADTGSAVTGAPAVSAGRLVVGTADGRLVAYAPA